MFDILVIDTHALLWFLSSDPRLGLNAEQHLRDPQVQIVIPTLVLAEACFLIETHRTSMTSTDDFFRLILGIRNVRLAALTSRIVRRSTSISLIRELHDRQIVATALTLIDRGRNVAIVTRDANITTAGVVPVIW